MSFISLYFLLFVLVVIVLYFSIPKKYRWIVILVASYFFYLINDLRSVIFIILTTVTIYLSTNEIKRINTNQKLTLELAEPDWLLNNKKDFIQRNKKKKKAILIATMLLNFGLLFFFKYFGYLSDAFANLIHVKPLNLNILFPLGISFYMFQSVGYLIDVYFGKVEPEKNIFKVALFVCFFPQLLQGPISKYNQLAPQLIDGNDFDFKKLKSGALLMLWGYFKKLVIANRANILYTNIMQNFTNFQGAEVFFGMLCFVLQLYCDFSGGIDIAMGTAECLGIELTPNFKRPFMALSTSDYWRRWHITLGTWMKDYVLYPLTLSKGYNKFIRRCKKTFKKGVAGKVIPSGIAMFIVFLLVGIWHGPNLTYLLFGIYNGVIVLVETIFVEARKLKKKPIAEISKGKRFFINYVKFTVTFMLVFFGKYFNAPNVTTAFNWFVATFKYTSASTLFNDFLTRTNFTITNFVILVVSTLFLISIEILQERGHHIREDILKKHIVWQWVIFFLAIVFIVLLTAYGTGGGFAYEKF